jgi:sulfite oxidase
VRDVTAAPDTANALDVHSAEPLCAGPDTAVLVDSYITPIDRYFVRNHGSVPRIDPSTYQLAVDGMVARPAVLALDDLKGQFEVHRVTVTLQCAGNRRSELHRVKPFENEVLWGGDAIGNAAWGGVRLADVLRSSQAAASATHVWFEGLDSVQRPSAATPFGASINLDRALADDVLICFEMNGEPLTPLHGAPARVVVPGAIGARSVKWLGRITVADRESDNHFQRNSYRLQDRSGAPEGAIEAAPLNAFIATPSDGQLVESGSVTVSGYAVAAGLGTLRSVDVSLDGGPWSSANPVDEPAPGVWSRWRLTVDLREGNHELRVRAHDSNGASQPEDLHAAWNPRGYLNNAVHAVRVAAEPPRRA